jgi:methylmalonyl-CoA/ethylmalonyl-CoA epimerase
MNNQVPQITGVLQLAIPVRDIARATAFYRDSLGLKFLMDAPNMAFFDCGGVRLYLDANEASQPASSNQFVYFRSTDIFNHVTALKTKDISIHQEPRVIAKLAHAEVWLMWIHDSEGNLLGIMEERKPAAAS